MLSRFLSKDFLAGLMFAGLGLFGLWLAWDLEVGTSDAMATGYFPRMICFLMIGTGAAVSVVALLKPGEPVPPIHWRPLALITLACAGFAVLFKPLGLVVTVIAAVLLAGFAGRGQRVLPLLTLGAALVLVTAGVFVYALRMPIPLWPTIF
jgi:hypothetical protein